MEDNGITTPKKIKPIIIIQNDSTDTEDLSNMKNINNHSNINNTNIQINIFKHDLLEEELKLNYEENNDNKLIKGGKWTLEEVKIFIFN
jgi:hypothetical protein